MFNNIVFTFQKNATFKKISFTLNRLTKKTSRGFSFFETFSKLFAQQSSGRLK